ncbi:MAG TPA: 3-hydroxyacyl-CoA dehydrogenase NAD-binding domain-containing protein, partial [Pseudomonadales bacterium]|nr:3-hydroxyacyl-CoA dehydrogenase NAD-binding domain-containing protein [Pseudomonadales bacterium]
MKRKVAVLGAGMFGTAIANILAENTHEVRLWSRDEDQAASIRI